MEDVTRFDPIVFPVDVIKGIAHFVKNQFVKNQFVNNHKTLINLT